MTGRSGRRAESELLAVIGAMMMGDLGGAVEDVDIGFGDHQSQGSVNSLGNVPE